MHQTALEGSSQRPGGVQQEVGRTRAGPTAGINQSTFTVAKEPPPALFFHMEKLFLTYNQIHQTVTELSRQITEDSFDFDYMVAIGTGGFIPARMLKTHINKPILTVGMAYYDLNKNPSEAPVVTQWLDKPEKQIKGRKILLVDEVDDTRSTIGFCLELLLKHQPDEVAVAVLHDKKKPKSREIPPEIKRYYRGLQLEDRWICYPWDAEDILTQDRLAGI